MNIGNSIDRLIGALSPIRGARRMAARQAMDALASYKGARRDRLKAGWLATGSSANAEIERDLKVLRQRARDLNRNDGTAAGLTSTLVANIVGVGSKPQARVDAGALGITEERAEEINKQIETAWDRFAMRSDVTGQLSFAACEALALRQAIESGEYLTAIEVIDRQIALNMIEPDRLDIALNQEAGDGKNEIRMGVELDSRGAPVAYHVLAQHPGDTRRLSNVKARRIARRNGWRSNMLHGFRLERPGQVRGVPWFAPVLDLFKDLNEYLEAERVAARVAACFALFIETGDPLNAAINFSTETQPDGKRLEALEPGIIQRLAPGEKATSFTPNRPGVTFDMFVMRLYRIMAAACDVPYELASKDFSQSNYSNMRGALLEARRVFKIHQQWLQCGFCQPIYDRVIEMAALRKEIDLPNFEANREAYTRARWIHPGWNWVDPEKEITASILAINNGLSTAADECASNGKDWEEIADQNDRERSRRRNSGAEDMKTTATGVELLARAGLAADPNQVGRALGLTLKEAPKTAQPTGVAA